MRPSATVCRTSACDTEVVLVHATFSYCVYEALMYPHATRRTSTPQYCWQMHRTCSPRRLRSQCSSYYMCPHTTIYVSSYYYASVLILLYMCPHTTMCPHILLYPCPHATIYVSSYYFICVLMLLYMCPHATIHVSSYY